MDERAQKGERRWPMAAAVLLAGVLRTFLPPELRLNDARPLVPVVLIVLMGALIVGDPGRIDRDKRWLRILTGSLIGLVTFTNAGSSIRLVYGIFVDEPFTTSASTLLRAGGIIWLTNVIAFGLWFWAVDQGGPVRRHEPDPPPHDFQFPQLENPELAEPGWYPKLFDYLYVSFTNSIAFSPTDSMPLTRRAKALMLAESAVSAVTVLLVAARAVNIFT